jgi:phosphoserine phosphatase
LGLWVLGHLRQKLGWSSRVAVISGNLSENAERKLQEYGVEAIFDKILVEDEPVLDWALERHTEDDSEEEE